MLKNLHIAANDQYLIKEIEVFNNKNCKAFIKSKKWDLCIGVAYIVINIVYLWVTNKAIPIYFLIPFFAFLFYSHKQIIKKKNERVKDFNLKNKDFFEKLGEVCGVEPKYFELKASKTLYYKAKSVIFSNYYEENKNNGVFYFYEFSRNDFESVAKISKNNQIVNYLENSMMYPSKTNDWSNIFSNNESFMTFVNMYNNNLIIGFFNCGAVESNEKIKNMLVKEMQDVMEKSQEPIGLFQNDIDTKMRESILNEKMVLNDKQEGRVVKINKKAKI